VIQKPRISKEFMDLENQIIKQNIPSSKKARGGWMKSHFKDEW
jgi:hypothetical protein